MDFYQQMATVADDLITQFGQKVTISSKDEQSYNPIDGTMSGVGNVSFDGVAVFEDFGYLSAGQQFNGALVEIGDKKITLASKGLVNVPKVGDKVVGSDGTPWKIVNIKETNPAGLSLIYEIQGRQ